MQLNNSMPTQERERRIYVSIVALSAIAYILISIRGYHHTFDDAMIYLRYMKNFVNGYGLVFNPGHKFNGLTSPGFTLPLAALSWATRNPHFSAWLICTITGFSSIVVWSRLFFSATCIELKRRSRGLAASCIGLILATFLPYFFLTYGMETTTFALVSGLVLRQYFHSKLYSAAVLAGLLASLRMEGGALLLGVILYQLIVLRTVPRNAWRLVLLFLIIPLFVFGFNWVYYDSPVAGTGLAKLWQGESGFWGEWSFLHLPPQVSELTFGGSVVNAVALGALALIGFWCLRRNRLAIILAIYLSIYSVVFVCLNIPNYHWYYDPYFTVLPFLSVVGAIYLLSLVSQSSVKTAVAAVVSLPLIICAYYSVRYDVHPAPPNVTYIQIGKWLKQNTKSNSSVALAEVGFVGYYSDRYIIDMLGLVNKYNAKFIGKRKLDGWPQYYEPTFVLVHEPLWPLEYGLYSVAFRYGVSQVCNFDFASFRLFRVGGIAGTASTCTGSHWIKVGGRNELKESPPARAPVVGHIAGSPDAIGNAVQVRVDVSDGPFTPASFELGSAPLAYGMAVPTASPPSHSRTWLVTAFFPTPAAANTWSTNPALFVRDRSGVIGRVTRSRPRPVDPTTLASALTGSSHCSLDGVSGRPATPIANLGQGATVNLSGWAVTHDARSSDSVRIVLSRGGASWAVPAETGVSRPDVATVLHSPPATDSGYTATFSTTGLALGTYRVSVWLAAPHGTELCDTERDIRIVPR